MYVYIFKNDMNFSYVRYVDKSAAICLAQSERTALKNSERDTDVLALAMIHTCKKKKKIIY